MAQKTYKEVKVSFYELVDQESGKRLPARDWNEQLNSLRPERAEEWVDFKEAVLEAMEISSPSLAHLQDRIDITLVPDESPTITVYEDKQAPVSGPEKVLLEQIGNEVIDELELQSLPVCVGIVTEDNQSSRQMSVTYNNRTLDGIVDGNLDRACLSLAIDRAISPRERHAIGGIRRQLKTSGPNWDAAEESIYVFFGRNLFGMIMTNIGAPSHSALASWLDVYAPIDENNLNRRWKAVPVVRKGVYEEVIKKRNMEVTGATFAFKPNEIEDPNAGIINVLLDRFTNTTSGLSIEIKISAGRYKNNSANSKYIVGELEEVLSDGKAERIKLKAKESGGRAREFDLIEDSIAYRVDLDRDALNKADTLAPVANEEIRTGFEKMSELLLKAVPETESV
ncbi:hypothetical protein EAH68_00205 [Corynebacterium hylobatis]|uniref:Uncharacterized protein n=1 Tax=Corynebacterium hylobatis TaxID=1859290 RepID=A0A430I203_9CORY|nr:hypothetical protein [Corynebacterium hylobatis]RSZ66020.1 hypothetical protein EAH68_00205 [Corynebacterium hylobatis]